MFSDSVQMRAEAEPKARVALEAIHLHPDSIFTLVCLPHAGGNASWYRCWKDCAEEQGISLYAVQYPGHLGLFSVPLASSIPHLASLIVEKIAKHAQSILLFGHSLGSLIAYEVTRQAYHEEVVFAGVHLSGSRAPSATVTNKRSLLAPPDLIASIGALDPGSPNILENKDISDALLPVVRHDLSIGEAYQRQPEKLDQVLHIHGGTDDPEFSSTDMPLWQDFSQHPLRLHSYPGNHFYLKEAAPSILSTMMEEINPLSHHKQTESSQTCV